jgi:Fe-S cluster assembly protein SufD
MSQAAYEQRLRDAVMDAAPLLDAKLLPVNVRSAALNRALAAGLPQLRDDLWRHADLKFLAAAPLAPSPAPPDLQPLLDAARALLPAPTAGFTRVVFVNGRHAPSLSDDCPELLAGTIPLVPERTRHERFGWLNDAFATGVARLTLAGTRQVEVLFANTAGDMPLAVYPRLEVMLEPGADVTLVERQVGATGASGCINSATQVHAGADSRCTHLRWQSLAADAQYLDTTQIALDRNAHYALSQLHLGGRSVRTSLRASLFGPGADFSLHGVSATTIRRTIDCSLLVDHIAARTVSRQVLRALTRDRAHLAFRSRVEVARTAPGSVAQQSLKGLLGDAGAEIDLRPQIEIHTDDVQATHGATTGALDENQRFYLMSRGLDAETARALLEWAFLEDALRGITNPLLRRAAEQSVATALGSHIAQQAIQ